MNQDVRALGPLHKLRRVHLYRLADMHGIRYRDGAPKLEMLPLLEAAGIDPTKPGPNGQRVVDFVPVTWKDENGRDHTSLEPKIPQPTSRNLDYEAAIAKAAARSAEAAAEKAVDDDRIAKLEADNAELRDQIADLIKVMKSGQSKEKAKASRKKRARASGKPDERKRVMGVFKLKQICLSHGLPYDRKDTAAMLRERLAAIGVYPPTHLPPEDGNGEDAA